VGRFSRASIGDGAFRNGEGDRVSDYLQELETVIARPAEVKDGFLTYHQLSALSEYRLVSSDSLSIVTVLLSQIIGTSQNIHFKNVTYTPEITALIELLTQMGAVIETTAPQELVIHKQEELKGFEIELYGDRNIAVFWTIAAVLTNGDITINGFKSDHLTPVYSKLTKAKIKYRLQGSLLHVWKDVADRLEHVEITSKPYPGFAEEWMLWLVVLATQAEGISKLTFRQKKSNESFLTQLKQLGAEIETKLIEENRQTVTVFGPTKLSSTDISAESSQQATALTLAALASNGTSTLSSAVDLNQEQMGLLQNVQKLGGRMRIVS
jgi:UDP-N-acetylglucosamine 1-carboxyvinyltransferase